MRPEAIRKELRAAKRNFARRDADLAEAQVNELLPEIEKLPGGPERWALNCEARVLKGAILWATYRPAQGNEAYAQILRLDPTYQLKPTEYSTSTRAQFEKVRRSTLAVRKVPLNVESTPSGANVFVDGYRVGTTPFAGELTVGDYFVTVGNSQSNSFPHRVSLQQSVNLDIDLTLEGAVDSEVRSCLKSSLNQVGSVDTAARIGSRVGADEVIVLARSPRSGETLLMAQTIDVRPKVMVRRGGVAWGDSAKNLGRLADYSVTGTLEPPVQEISIETGTRKSESASSDAPAGSPAAADITPQSPSVAQPSTPVASLPESGTRDSARDWYRAGAYSSIGVGAVGILISQLVHHSSDSKVARVRELTGGRWPITNPEAQTLSEEVNQSNARALAIGIPSVILALVGLEMVVLEPVFLPSKPKVVGPVSVRVEPNLEGLLVSGSF